MKRNVLALVGLSAILATALSGCSPAPVASPTPTTTAPTAPTTPTPTQATSSPDLMADAAPGPRLTITAATGCPASDKDPAGELYVGVTNPPPTWTGTFLPNPSPTSALICNYYGRNDAPFTLQSHTLLNMADATTLATAMNQAPLTCPFCDGTYYCPMDDDSITIVVFTYAERPDVAIWMKANGCATMSNGTIVIYSIDSPLLR